MSPWPGRLWVSLLFVGLLASRVSRADELGELEKARAAYLARRYEDAEQALRFMLRPEAATIREPTLVAEARMYWGASLFSLGRREEAKKQFLEILKEHPNYEPDPLRLPAEVVNAFIDTRTENRQRLQELEIARAKHAEEQRAREKREREERAQKLARIVELAESEKIVHKNSRVYALIPFGAGQIQNGERTLGWVFLGVQSAMLLGAAITIPYYVGYVSDANEANGRRDYASANAHREAALRTRSVNLAFIAGFALTAISGVVQAQVAYVPQWVEEKKRPLPPELRPDPKISWSPTVHASGAGIDLGIRF